MFSPRPSTTPRPEPGAVVDPVLKLTPKPSLIPRLRPNINSHHSLHVLSLQFQHLRPYIPMKVPNQMQSKLQRVRDQSLFPQNRRPLFHYNPNPVYRFLGGDQDNRYGRCVKQALIDVQHDPALQHQYFDPEELGTHSFARGRVAIWVSVGQDRGISQHVSVWGGR